MRPCSDTVCALSTIGLIAACLAGCSKRGESARLTKPQSGQTNVITAQLTNRDIFDRVADEATKAATGETEPRWEDTTALAEPPREQVGAEDVKDLQAKAEKGDPEAQYQLGKKLWLTDPAEADKWIIKAAVQDHKEACFYAGLHFAAVNKPTYNPSNAFVFFLRGAELSNSACAYWAGLGYLKGEGVETNIAEGVKWLEKSADQGNVTAQVDLARRYHEADALPRNVTKALHYYELAAEARFQSEANRVLCQCQLGYIHATETKDYAEAAKWYRKAAEAGNASAQCNLGSLYADGLGVAQSYAEALKWYRLAAQAGESQAECELGSLYMLGHGVPQDHTEAAKWYRKAADQGKAGPQANLSYLYLNGLGVPKDYIEAYKWANLAAAQGVEEARTNRHVASRFMTPEQIAEAQRRSSAFAAKQESREARSGQRLGLIPVDPKATGSAFFITDDGYLLACAHVLEEATRVEITASGKQMDARLLKVDKANDVALLKVVGTFKALPLSASRGAKLGDTIFTIGFPNTLVQGIDPKLTKGEISSLAGVQDDPRHFQISVPVQPGNSGGPLVDLSGNVIGLVTARLGDLATLKITGSLPQNVNYALKSSFITAFLETLPEVSAKLKAPHPTKERPVSELADKVKQSVVLVTVY